jgi:hypothetical protein
MSDGNVQSESNMKNPWFSVCVLRAFLSLSLSLSLSFSLSLSLSYAYLQVAS